MPAARAVARRHSVPGSIELPIFLTAHTASDLLPGVSRGELQRAIREGFLPTLTIRGQPLIRRADLMRFLKSRRRVKRVQRSLIKREMYAAGVSPAVASRAKVSP